MLAQRKNSLLEPVVRATSPFALTKPELVCAGVPAEDRPPPVSRLSPFESYNVLREQLQHEDNLITQRLPG